jgi:hypothetical protein
MTRYVGLDVSLNETSVCVLDDRGHVRFESRFPSVPDAIVQCLRQRTAEHRGSEWRLE